MDRNLIEVLMMDIKDVLELTDFRKINFTPQNNFSIKLSNNEVKTRNRAVSYCVEIQTVKPHNPS